MAVIAVVLLTRGDSAGPRVSTNGNPFFAPRGPLIGDEPLLRDAAKAWKHARGREVQALWAGPAPGGGQVVVLGEGTRGALVRRDGGDWSVQAEARRVSAVAPLSFGSRGVLLPGDSGRRVVSVAPATQVGVAPARLVDDMVLPASRDDAVPPGFVPPDRAYGAITAFGNRPPNPETVAYKVSRGDDARIARLVAARHGRAVYGALFPGDRPGAGDGVGIGTTHVLSAGRFGARGYGVAMSHSHNSAATTAVSVGFDREGRAPVLLGLGAPPFAGEDRPVFGVDTPEGDRGPVLIAGDRRIPRYEVHRGTRRTTVPGPIAVLPRGTGIDTVIGRTAAGAPVLPVGE